jgi:predicted GH43/DUF377 family glycosyl hydrolase
VTAVDRTWVRRTDHILRPDPARVVARLFLPGQEVSTSGTSRSEAVIHRALTLTDDEVDAELRELEESFGARHRSLVDTWESHFALLEHRLVGDELPSLARRRLIGAYFTQEFSVEGAALFNPSLAMHPDQSGLADGSVRFVMTVRAVGEGHISSIELRTGTIDSTGDVSVDAPPTVAVLATTSPARYSRGAFENQLIDMWGDRTNSDFVLDALPETFGREELDVALQSLRDQRLTRGAATRTMGRFEWIAGCTYSVEFPSTSDEQERVLMPRGPSETTGMEDVRLVRFLDDPSWDYVGTYTAYDGERISTQMISTSDFRSFAITRLSGPGSKNKGLALFPRRIGGRYVAMSRADRESNGITMSDDLQHWDRPVLVQTPREPWEIVQLGNCGPPIETEQGWLVLTHGVGPMRQYGIGALLLDLDDPTVVLGCLRQPLLSPEADERDGYVPNVVYSCGGMVHGRTLVLPYGTSDTCTRFALIDLDPLLAELAASPALPTLLEGTS